MESDSYYDKHFTQINRYLDILNTILLILNEKGEIDYINEKGAGLLGYSQKELIGLNWFDMFLSAHEIEGVKDVFKKLMSGEIEPVREYSNAIKSRDGSIKKILWHNDILIENNKIVGTVSFGIDITERSRQREEITSLNRLFNEAQAMAHIGNWSYDIVKQTIWASDEIFRIYGFDISDDNFVDYKIIHESVFPDDREITEKALKDLINKNTDYDIVFRIYKSGNKNNIRWLHAKAILSESDGNPIVKGVLQDITRTRMLLDEISKQNNIFKSTFGSVNEGVITTDSDGMILMINPVAESLTGYSAAIAKGKSLSRILSLYDEKKHAPIPTQAGYYREIHKSRVFEDIILRDKNGAVIPVDCIFSRIYDENDVFNGLVVVFNDIGISKLNRQKEQKMAKLESLSFFASGIAHDFNNILTAIQGNLTLLRSLDKKECGKEQLDILNEAIEATKHARILSGRLLSFSKGNATHKKTIDLSRLVTDTVNFILRGSEVRCDFRFESGLYDVFADPDQLNQVIQNLIINAKQAMNDHGHIICRLENIDMDAKKRVLFPSFSDSHYLHLTIEDNGQGIPKDILPNIFDPYFTTKKEGSGLGLSIAHSVISNHNGTMEVESGTKGTTFHIYLPAKPKKITEEKIYASQAKTIPLMRVLIMDDEPQIRTLFSRMLSLLGCDVMSTDKGEEAVDAVKNKLENNENFDIAILDLNVKHGMGGEKTALAIKNLTSDIKIVACSGYSENDSVEKLLLKGFDDYMKKPFGFEDIKALLLKHS